MAVKNSGRESKAVWAAIVGNLLEFFDFMSYAYFAVPIGQAFFPAHSDFGKTMLSLVTFGVGFITRPLGAVVFGWYADRAGRRAALSWSFGLMALGTGLLGLTPPLAVIGLAAPLLVVFARLVQGFASGGETGPASVFLCDQSKPGHRSYLPSYQFGTQAIAGAIATGIGAAASAFLPHHALALWGWRVPFLLGIFVAPIGLYLRRQMAEEKSSSAPDISVGAALIHAPRAVLANFLINAGETIRVYIQVYFVTFAVLTLHLPAWQGMLATMLAAVATAIISPWAGALIRDEARLKLVLWSEFLSILVIYPLFLLVKHHPGLWSLSVLTVGFSVVVAPRSGAGLSLMIDCLPAAARTAGFGVAYALAATVFGATTQTVVTWSIHSTGNPLAPAWYLMGSLLVATAAYVWILPKENLRGSVKKNSLDNSVVQANSLILDSSESCNQQSV